MDSAPNKDLASILHPVQHIIPGNHQATVTGNNGSGVDLAGYESASVLINVGARTTGTFVFTLEESDDDSTYAAMAAADVNGSLPTVSSAGTASQVYQVGLKRAKRYVRAVATGASTPNIDFGVTVVRGNKRHEP